MHGNRVRCRGGGAIHIGGDQNQLQPIDIGSGRQVILNDPGPISTGGRGHKIAIDTPLVNYTGAGESREDYRFPFAVVTLSTYARGLDVVNEDFLRMGHKAALIGTFYRHVVSPGGMDIRG